MAESNNLPQVLAALGLKKTAYDNAVAAAADEIAFGIESVAKRMTMVKRKNHPYPAVSGKPPMQVSGNLHTHIEGKSKRKGFGVYVAEVGSYMEYARVLEFGGAPTWTRGQKFPYMQPSLEQYKRTHQIQNIIIKHLRRA